jgi:hypothetical protein
VAGREFSTLCSQHRACHHVGRQEDDRQGKSSGRGFSDLLPAGRMGLTDTNSSYTTWPLLALLGSRAI